MRHRKIAPIAFCMRCGADIAVRRACERSRKRKLRELYHVNSLLAAPPGTVVNWVISDEPDENERRFLDQNDITKYVIVPL